MYGVESCTVVFLAAMSFLAVVGCIEPGVTLITQRKTELLSIRIWNSIGQPGHVTTAFSAVRFAAIGLPYVVRSMIGLQCMTAIYASCLCCSLFLD